MKEPAPTVPSDFVAPPGGLLSDLGRRRLPIRVTPLPDETLPSWLEHAARELHFAPATLAKHIGLSLARAHLGNLTGGEIQTVEDLARLPAGSLPPSRQPYAAYWAAPGSRVAYCPGCLEEREGRWRMSWAMPWAFACTAHQLELNETCPTCGQVPRVPERPYLELITAPSTCHRLAADDPRLGRLAPRCNGTLAHAAARPATSALLTAQQWIDELFSSDGAPRTIQDEVQLTGLAVPVAWAVRDLLAVSLLLDGYALPGRLLDQPDDGEPDSRAGLAGATAMTAPGLIRLHEVASAASPDEAVQRWRALGQRPPTLTELQTRVPSRPSPWLQALVLRGERTNMWARRRLAHRADAATPLLALEHFSHGAGGPDWPLVASSGLGTPIFLDASHLPATLWASASKHVLGDLDVRRHDSLIDLRAVLSMSALVVGRMRSWGETAAQLGLPEQSVLDASRLLRGLRQKGQLDSALETLQELVEFLHAQPVNICYWRRRRLFTKVPPLTRKLERRVWTALGATRKTKKRLGWSGLLEVRLAEMLTGSDHLHLNLTTDARLSYRALRKSEPDLDQALEPLGERLLLRHRLNEPLTAKPHKANGQWQSGEQWQRRLTGWDEPSYEWRSTSRSLSTGGGRGANRNVDLLSAIRFDSASRDRARLVLAAVEAQNAAQAARTLGVKAATVISAVNWFEENLPGQVFDRRKHAGAIGLTADGKRFVLAAGRMLAGQQY